jgi:hypothetical protein
MPRSERKVLIIGTGGTIASEPTVNGYAPVSLISNLLPYPNLPNFVCPLPALTSELLSGHTAQLKRYPILILNPPLNPNHGQL